MPRGFRLKPVYAASRAHRQRQKHIRDAIKQARLRRLFDQEEE